FRQTCRYGAEQFGSGDDGGNRQVVGQVQRCLASDLGRAEHDFQWRTPSRAWRHDHMARLLVIPELQSAGEGGMILAPDYDQRLFAQWRIVQVGRIEVQIVDGRVQSAVSQAYEQVVGVVAVRHDLYQRRDLRQMRLQCRQQCGLGVVIE